MPPKFQLGGPFRGLSTAIGAALISVGIGRLIPVEGTPWFLYVLYAVPFFLLAYIDKWGPPLLAWHRQRALPQQLNLTLPERGKDPSSSASQAQTEVLMRLMDLHKEGVELLRCDAEELSGKAADWCLEVMTEMARIDRLEAKIFRDVTDTMPEHLWEEGIHGIMKHRLWLLKDFVAQHHRTGAPKNNGSVPNSYMD